MVLISSESAKVGVQDSIESISVSLIDIGMLHHFGKRNNTLNMCWDSSSVL